MFCGLILSFSVMFSASGSNSLTSVGTKLSSNLEFGFFWVKSMFC